MSLLRSDGEIVISNTNPSVRGRDGYVPLLERVTYCPAIEVGDDWRVSASPRKLTADTASLKVRNRKPKLRSSVKLINLGGVTSAVNRVT